MSLSGAGHMFMICPIDCGRASSGYGSHSPPSPWEASRFGSSDGFDVMASHLEARIQIDVHVVIVVRGTFHEKKLDTG